MKPKWYELVPFYGAIKYFNRYFKKNETNINDAIIAEYVFFYHCSITPLIIILIVKIIFR
jgi:hypothetical protein